MPSWREVWRVCSSSCACSSVRAVFIAGNRFCSHRGECVIRDFISGRLHCSYGGVCHKVVARVAKRLVPDLDGAGVFGSRIDVDGRCRPQGRPHLEGLTVIVHITSTLYRRCWPTRGADPAHPCTMACGPVGKGRGFTGDPGVGRPTVCKARITHRRTADERAMYAILYASRTKGSRAQLLDDN